METNRQATYDIERLREQLSVANITRAPESVIAQYEYERAAAQRLINASREERSRLYAEVYNELFERFSDHPELQRPREILQQRAQQQADRVRRLCNSETVLLEIGAGDCYFSRAIAPFVKHVYALEVTPLKLHTEELPPNVQFKLFDGFDFPIDSESIDIAYSNQVLEHLHPEDALYHLREVHRVLRSGGKYLCITPYRYTGPHDVSKFFTETASGLHLKEYTYRDLSWLMRKVGFKKVSVQARRPTPLWLVLLVERFLETMALQHRRSLIHGLRYPDLRSSIAMIGHKS